MIQVGDKVKVIKSIVIHPKLVGYIGEVLSEGCIKGIDCLFVKFGSLMQAVLEEELEKVGDSEDITIPKREDFI